MKIISLIKTLSVASVFMLLPSLKADYDYFGIIMRLYKDKLDVQWDLNTEELSHFIEFMRDYIDPKERKSFSWSNMLYKELDQNPIDGPQLYILLRSEQGLQFIANLLYDLGKGNGLNLLETALNLFHDIPPLFSKTCCVQLCALINLLFERGHYKFVVTLFDWIKPLILGGELLGMNKRIWAMSEIQKLIVDEQEIEAFSKCIYTLSDEDILQIFQNHKSTPHKYIDPTPLYNAFKGLIEHKNDQTEIENLTKVLSKIQLAADIGRNYNFTVIDKNTDSTLILPAGSSCENMANRFMDFFRDSIIPDFALWNLSVCLANCPSQGFLANSFLGSNPNERLPITLNGQLNIEFVIGKGEHEQPVFTLTMHEVNCPVQVFKLFPASCYLGMQPVDINIKVSLTVISWESGVVSEGNRAQMNIEVDPNSYIRPSQGKDFIINPPIIPTPPNQNPSPVQQENFFKKFFKKFKKTA